MRTIHTLAPAKINVYLRIVGRRPDGYHLLDSLMLPVNLCDEIRIAAGDGKSEAENQKAKGKRQKQLSVVSSQLSVPNIQHPTPSTQAEAAGGESQIVLTCDDPAVPGDETNLAYKAAALLIKETGIRATISLRLRKHIPAGAGLGGGSSNAAAVLKGLNTLLSLRLSEDRLCQLGARLGADVPFFIPCRPSRVEGIGELLTAVPPLPHRWLVLVVPPFGVSTLWAYRRFDELQSSDASLRPRPNIPPSQWPARELLVNDLEQAVFPEYPQIAAIKSALLNLGADGAVMSGSGSSIFGVFQDKVVAEHAANTLQQWGRTFLTEPLDNPFQAFI